MHAVRAQLERRVDVVVHDEGRTEVAEAAAARDDLGRGRLQAELHDRRAGDDGAPRRREVGTIACTLT